MTKKSLRNIYKEMKEQEETLIEPESEFEISAYLSQFEDDSVENTFSLAITPLISLLTEQSEKLESLQNALSEIELKAKKKVHFRKDGAKMIGFEYPENYNSMIYEQLGYTWCMIGLEFATVISASNIIDDVCIFLKNRTGKSKRELCEVGSKIRNVTWAEGIVAAGNCVRHAHEWMHKWNDTSVSQKELEIVFNYELDSIRKLERLGVNVSQLLQGNTQTLLIIKALGLDRWENTFAHLSRWTSALQQTIDRTTR